MRHPQVARNLWATPQAPKLAFDRDLCQALSTEVLRQTLEQAFPCRRLRPTAEQEEGPGDG